jgi:hypothetical protein
VNASKGIRPIQSGRYEIFVQAEATEKETFVFDWLCEEVWNILQDSNVCYESPASLKEAIIQYAVKQAERDDRLLSMVPNKDAICYDNFALIVSYAPVGAQLQHIDLLYPNFQFGLIMTDQSPGTTVCQASHSINTIDDIKKHVWRDMPTTLYTQMKQNEFVASLVSQFGGVLCPDIQSIDYSRNIKSSTVSPVLDETFDVDKGSNSDAVLFPTGTVTSLPGSEVHAGPSSNKHRTVLFFSACPDTNNTIPYDPDTQSFAPLLLCEFISILWDSLCVDDRVFMLQRLLDSINITKCQHLERHIGDDNMNKFLKIATNWEKNCKATRTTKKYEESATVNDFIYHFASGTKKVDTSTSQSSMPSNTKTKTQPKKRQQNQRKPDPTTQPDGATPHTCCYCYIYTYSCYCCCY